MPRREPELMEMKEQVAQAPCLIRSYGRDGFEIAGQRYQGPVLVLPERVYRWEVSTISNLQLADFGMLLDGQADIDLILLGGGPRLIFPESGLKEGLAEYGIAIEAMDTGAAARTFNVLLAEERRVAAALLPIQPAD